MRKLTGASVVLLTLTTGPFSAQAAEGSGMIRSGKPSRQPKGWLPLKTVRWVTIVAIMVVSPPVGFAESTDDPLESAPFSREPGEPTDFSQEDGDGILESGETEQEELAKAAQNPVASMISLPFQNNSNFGWGPDDDTQNVLNIQPVWPINLTDNWNVITRTILPVISQPGAPGPDGVFRYRVSAEDFDRDRPLRFSLEDGPEGMTVDGRRGLVEWTPNAEQSGRHRIEIVVHDSQGASGRQIFELVVGDDPVYE